MTTVEPGRTDERLAAVEEAVVKIQALLWPPEDTEPSQWTYEELREMIARTDLRPAMPQQRLENVGQELADLETRIDKLGETDAHHDEQTLENRLDIIEGGIQILEGGHLGHTNSDANEFRGMHGFSVEALGKQLNGMQKKLDRIAELLKDKQFTVTGERALKM